LQVGDTGPVESARRSNSRVLGSPFSGLSGHYCPFKYKSSTYFSHLPQEIYNFLYEISVASENLKTCRVPYWPWLVHL
jgi:hypothetical protein